MGEDFSIDSHKKEINNYEIYIQQLYSNKQNFSNRSNDFRGFIIHLEDYTNIREKKSSNDIKNINKIGQIPFRTSSYLINMIYNKNMYIIITEELWKKICHKGKENETPVNYKITDTHLILSLDKELKFKNNGKNIISIENYSPADNSNYTSNFDEIENIYESITNYYEFEKNFPNSVKSNNIYFVEQNWFDEWKKYINYESMKKYLDQKANQQIIKNDIIAYNEAYKDKDGNLFTKLYPINIIKIEKKQDIELYRHVKSLVILSYDFVYYYYAIPVNIKPINFTLSNNLFQFYCNSQLLFSSKVNGNIISLNEINELNSSNSLIHSKLLMKNFYFQKEFQTNMKSPHNKFKNNISNKYIYLINKKFFNYYQQYFQSNNLYDLLNKSDKNKVINNNNLEILLQSTNNYNLYSIKEKEFSEKFKFNPSDYNFIIKPKIENERKTLFYINDFEIIDEEIANYFIQKSIISNEQIIKSNYIIGDGKILIIFNYHKYNYYEIGYIDNNNQFIIEYLLEEGNKIYKNEIFEAFNEHGIIHIITNNFPNYNGNTVKSKNRVIGYYYKMNAQTGFIKNNTNNNIPLKEQNNNLMYLNNGVPSPSPSAMNQQGIEVVPQVKKNPAGAIIPNLNNNEIPFNQNKISEKLKTLLLLSMIKFRDNIHNSQKEGKIEKVKLINNNWLNNYEYNKINSLVNNNEVFNVLKASDDKQFDYNSPTFDNIISKLNPQQLNSIDQNVNKINNKFPLEPKEENIQLSNQKIIKIYKEFTLINEQLYNLLKRNFSLPTNTINIKETNFYMHKDIDVLSISNDIQNTILFGKLEKSTNTYNIDYIFEYKKEIKIEDELDKINRMGHQRYILEKTMFNLNDKRNDDKISPIFRSNSNDIKGLCYKYYNSINDYSKFIDYSQILFDEDFKKMLSFNENYVNIKKKMNNYSQEKYYLINKDTFNKIKQDCYFDEISKIFGDNKVHENLNKKTILLNVKKMTRDKLLTFLNKPKTQKYNKQFMNPIVTPFNRNNEKYFIYDNFEMLDKLNANLFFMPLDEKEINYLDCILTQGKIMIKYPVGIEGNNKSVCVIGSLDNDNTFIKEYILIYDDHSYCNKHIDEIKYNLKNYLNGLSLYNNTAPITNKKLKEKGIIIKIGSNIEDLNLNNNGTNTDNVINDVMNNGYYIDESEYNLNFKTDSPFIKHHFSVPPLIGLQNIGATCYMNATLQCFCHIEKFVNFFKYSQQVIQITKQDKKKLTSSFKLLMEKLWPNNWNPNKFSNKKDYAPEEFKIKISKMNPLFRGVAANDSKDLVNFIIMTLHEELNKADKKRQINTSTTTIFDQRNAQTVFNNYANNFMLENKSIISDLFYGMNCNTTQCGGCRVKTFNYQTYFFLVFPLEEVRKYKMSSQFAMNYSFNMFNNNEVNIYDCFEYDRKIEMMMGANTMYCNYCKQTCNSSMCTTLTTGPEILILLLNRGKGIEFNVKINFVIDLNLSNYIQYANTGCKYKLMGVITHMGESGMGGHFIAYCLDPISGTNWHKYNDSIVTQVKDFQKEVIDYAMPYLLFYQKIQ